MLADADRRADWWLTAMAVATPIQVVWRHLVTPAVAAGDKYLSFLLILGGMTAAGFTATAVADWFALRR